MQCINCVIFALLPIFSMMNYISLDVWYIVSQHLEFQMFKVNIDILYIAWWICFMISLLHCIGYIQTNIGTIDQFVLVDNASNVTRSCFFNVPKFHMIMIMLWIYVLVAVWKLILFVVYQYNTLISSNVTTSLLNKKLVVVWLPPRLVF